MVFSPRNDKPSLPNKRKSWAGLVVVHITNIYYLDPFRRLHRLHNIWQLSAVVVPPSAHGVIWSPSICSMTNFSPHAKVRTFKSRSCVMFTWGFSTSGTRAKSSISNMLNQNFLFYILYFSFLSTTNIATNFYNSFRFFAKIIFSAFLWCKRTIFTPYMSYISKIWL